MPTDHRISRILNVEDVLKYYHNGTLKNFNVEQVVGLLADEVDILRQDKITLLEELSRWKSGERTKR